MGINNHLSRSPVGSPRFDRHQLRADRSHGSLPRSNLQKFEAHKHDLNPGPGADRHSGPGSDRHPGPGSDRHNNVGGSGEHWRGLPVPIRTAVTYSQRDSIDRLE